MGRRIYAGVLQIEFHIRPVVLMVCLALGMMLSSVIVSSELRADEIRIATQTEITTLDPHVDATGQNLGIFRHLYDLLVFRDAEQNLKPGLAVSWKFIGDDTWEIKLRPGVRFHDGSDFTSDDVVFSYDRVRTIKSTAATYRLWTSTIDSVEAKGPLTVHIRTTGPSPTLPNNLSMISIVSKKLTEGMEPSDFDTGRAAVGTGPYMFVEWVRGDRVVFKPNPNYWGGVEPWDKVTFRPITNSGARTAALLAGDIDVVERVPSENLQRLKETDGIAISSRPSSRALFMAPDVFREESPDVVSADGKPMAQNPMKDQRVRRAMSIAINREAIVDKILNGEGAPSGQLVFAGGFGWNPDIDVPKYDPEMAKKLIAEAGYPEGFGVTLTATNDRYPKDAATALAIAQMFTRVGIKTEVRPVPASIFFTQARTTAYSLQMSGAGGTNGEPSASLLTYLATHDKSKSSGLSNNGRYSNPEVDALLSEAMGTVDDQKRSDLFAKVMAMAVEDGAIIPLFHFVNTWALRGDLSYDARADEATLAMGVRKKAAN